MKFSAKNLIFAGVILISILSCSNSFAAVSNEKKPVLKTSLPLAKKPRGLTEQERNHLEDLKDAHSEKLVGAMRSKVHANDAAGLAVELSYLAMRSLEDGQVVKASNQAKVGLEAAISAANETGNNRDVSFRFRCQDQDFVKDEANAKKTWEQLRAQVKANDATAARVISNTFVSQIECYMPSVDTSFLLEQLKKMNSLIGKNDFDGARVAARQIMQSQKSHSYTIFMPIERAKAFVDEADRLLSADKSANREQIDLLLSQAAEQMRLAEILGYVERKKTSPVQTLLKMAQDNISHDKDNNETMAKISDSIRSLQ